MPVSWSCDAFPLSRVYHKTSPARTNPIEIIIDEFGLVRIKEPIRASLLASSIEWLSETEPNSHYDIAASMIMTHLKALPVNCLSISYRDREFLELLETKINIQNSLIWFDRYKDEAGDIIRIEYCQEKLSDPGCFQSLENFAPNLIVANRILHHVAELDVALENLYSCLSHDGFLLVEIPDCSKAFLNLDYTVIFEEHNVYFTEHSLKNALIRSGFRLVTSLRFSDTAEDSITVLAQKVSDSQFKQNSINYDLDRDLFTNFCAKYPSRVDAFRRTLSDLSQAKTIILYGSGHHAACFMAVYKCVELIDFVVDDDVRRIDFSLPGSELEIRGTKEVFDLILRERKKDVLILLAVSQIHIDHVCKKIKKQLHELNVMVVHISKIHDLEGMTYD